MEIDKGLFACKRLSLQSAVVSVKSNLKLTVFDIYSSA